MDYVVFAKQFFAASGIPVNLLLDGRPLYASISEQISYYPQETWTLHEPTRNPEFSAITPDLVYGHVQIEGTGYDLYLGPIFTVPPDDALILQYFRIFRIPEQHHEDLQELLYRIPVGTHGQFMRWLMFLHSVLNNVSLAADDIYQEAEDKKIKRGHRESDSSIQAKENEVLHNSYLFEQKLYHCVKQGSAARLTAFLESTPQLPNEGKMAHSPLRQAKNIFIGTVTKVAMLSAIPAGVDIEKTYQLVDLYCQECETLQSIEEVHRLQYIMLMDFCKRCEEAKRPENISVEIYQAMTYIQNHTNTTISVDDVATHVHRSSSHLMRQFRSETGKSVGEYITECKMEDACDLLTYGNLSLAEISAYLGYSSQSYFQNIFKKRYGITPMQYRKEHHKV